MDLLKQANDLVQVVKSGACAKPIYADEVNFMCDTCAGSTSVFCPSCFYNGDHLNHDYRLSMNLVGLCDCGDESSYIQESCCSNHPLVQVSIFDGVTFDSFSEVFDLLVQFQSFLQEPQEDQTRQIYDMCEQSPILLRIIVFTLFFQKQQKQFLFNNINNIDILLDVINQNNFANHLLVKLESFVFVDLLTQDFYFRVFSVLLFSHNLEQLIIWPNRAIQMMSVQILTEPKTQIYVAQFKIYSRLLRFMREKIQLKSQLDGKLLQVTDLFYQFQQISQPHQVKYLFIYDHELFEEILRFHEVVNFYGKINPDDCGENFNTFLQEVNIYVYYIKFIIGPFYAICNYSDLEIGSTDVILSRQHIKGDVRSQCSINTNFYQSVNFQLAVEMVSVQIKFSQMQTNYFLLFPQQFIQIFITNQIYRLNLDKAEYFSMLASKLNIPLTDLIDQLLQDPYIFLIFKQQILSQTCFKKHIYELGIAVNFCANDSFFSNHWFKIVNFVQFAIPLAGKNYFKDNNLIKLEILNQILFNINILDEELFLRIFLSLQFVQIQDAKLSGILDKTGFRRNLVLDAAREIFNTEPNPKKLKSAVVKLKTSSFVEPSMIQTLC
ncbi:putative zinc finger in N-recognin (UBR box) domain-containing protein [Spironucleus salmonicida]|uniref:E3 ubiquitin-protein ligase n=2 Tax=Spironucleus salmonicida TaxID=348837 RepID=A0A9P8LQU5_9EUKA|nr:putative zinc finger in N-recognin (UBR box) domain-containing protein [Spironucleus salmonicida]